MRSSLPTPDWQRCRCCRISSFANTKKRSEQQRKNMKKKNRERNGSHISGNSFNFEKPIFDLMIENALSSSFVGIVSHCMLGRRHRAQTHTLTYTPQKGRAQFTSGRVNIFSRVNQLFDETLYQCFLFFNICSHLTVFRFANVIRHSAQGDTVWEKKAAFWARAQEICNKFNLNMFCCAFDAAVGCRLCRRIVSNSNHKCTRHSYPSFSIHWLTNTKQHICSIFGY